MNEDKRFLMLDVYGDLVELHGTLLNIGALLGNTMEMFQAAPGLCFAVSTTPSARYAEPNLHLSWYARRCSEVVAPFFGSAVVFGGLQLDPDAPRLVDLDPGCEQQLRASVAATCKWFAAHPEDAARGSKLANRLRHPEAAHG